MAGSEIIDACTCTDGRQRRQQERAARQELLEQAALLSRRLAHDFGNVLTPIIGFCELALAQGNVSASVLLRYLAEINRSAQGGSQLTQQLQAFSRRQPAANPLGSLTTVLDEEETRLRTLENGTVRCQVQVVPDLPPVALDQEALRQIVAALLDNAREAIGPNGSITVAAQAVVLSEADCHDYYGTLHPGPHVLLCVQDTGPGLSEEAQRRLFVEPFYTSKARRRGFGLSVAYGLLSAHHGGLDVSNAPAGGAIASVLLPVAVSGCTCCHEIPAGVEPVSALPHR